MNNLTKSAALVLLVVGAGMLVWWYQSSRIVKTPVATATYICTGAKTFTAAFFDGETVPPTSDDAPPTPGGSVDLRFADGSVRSLRQTISADGGRYASADESFVFWSKGNGAIVLEQGKEESYVGCAAIVDDTWTVPEALTAGTNLSSDTRVVRETKAGVASCTAELFLEQKTVARTVTEGGVTYSVASTSDAGAGNRYEESVYALAGSSPCTAVRYFVHYSAFENYPTGAIKEFDKAALRKELDAVRHVLLATP